MARTALTVTILKQNNYIPSAGDLLVPMACDTVNTNSLVITGREVLIAVNTDTVPHTFTLTSIADHLGRTGDITTYSVPAMAANVPGVAAIQLSQLEGWKQADSTVTATSSHADLTFGVLRYT